MIINHFHLQLHLDDHTELENNETEMDFFEAHENFDVNNTETNVPKDHVHADPVVNLVNESQEIKDNDNIHAKSDNTKHSKEALGPSVNVSEFAMLGESDRKPTIGVRKPQARKTGVSFVTFVSRHTYLIAFTKNLLIFAAGQENELLWCSKDRH